jgi:iron complex transport system substrate-binding protein
MKRIIISILVLSLLAFLITGCNKNGVDEKQSNIDTVIITDMADRKVEIPAKISKVATIGTTARMITYAGCADKIAGLSELEKTAPSGMPYAFVNKEHFSGLPAIASGGANSITYEEVLATLDLDIIFINYSDINTVNTLQEKLGVPVVILDYIGIFSESVYTALKLTGEIMGTEKHCTELIEAMKSWQADLDNRTKDITDANKPSVYAGAVSYRGGHGIEGTYAKYPPFVAINAKNVVDETGEDGPLILEKEKILTWNPDIIFLTPRNMNLVNSDYKINPSFYNNLKAVKENKLYSQINYNFYGTNVELAIVDTYYAGSIIYPDAFSDIDFYKKADEIFTKMLGQTYIEIIQDSGNNFGKISIGD